jgi:hypothetical protein
MTATFIIFMLLMAAGQLVRVRAIRSLNTEQKALVADSSGQTIWFFVVLAILYGAQTYVSHIFGDPRWLMPVFTVAVFVIAVGFAVVQVRRIAHLGLPAHYIRSVRWSLLLGFTGLLLLFGGMFYDFWVAS